jgi:hypothetical protein
MASNDPKSLLFILKIKTVFARPMWIYGTMDRARFARRKGHIVIPGILPKITLEI